MVLDDREQIRRAGELYRDILVPRVSTMLETKLADGDEAGARISRSILYLADKMPEVPAIVIPCYDQSLKLQRYSRLLQQEMTMSPEMNSASYGSIYPAVWSFQLALRSRGLGSAFTTAHQFDQPGMAKNPRHPRDVGSDLSHPRGLHHRRRLHAVTPRLRGGCHRVEPRRERTVFVALLLWRVLGYGAAAAPHGHDLHMSERLVVDIGDVTDAVLLVEQGVVIPLNETERRSTLRVSDDKHAAAAVLHPLQHAVADGRGARGIRRVRCRRRLTPGGSTRAVREWSGIPSALRCDHPELVPPRVVDEVGIGGRAINRRGAERTERGW